MNIVNKIPVLNCKWVTEDDYKEKPQIKKLYDITKNGTDLMDRRIRLVSLSLKILLKKVVYATYEVAEPQKLASLLCIYVLCVVLLILEKY